MKAPKPVIVVMLVASLAAVRMQAQDSGMRQSSSTVPVVGSTSGARPGTSQPPMVSDNSAPVPAGAKKTTDASLNILLDSAKLPDPVVGQPISAVIKALGQPSGTIQMPDKIILFYDRGQVTIRNGVVDTVELKSAAEYIRQMAEDAADSAPPQSQKEMVNAQLKALMNDPRYLALPTLNRILELQRFDHEHKGSDADKEIKSLLNVYYAELRSSTLMDDSQSRMPDLPPTRQTSTPPPQSTVAPRQPPPPSADTQGGVTVSGPPVIVTSGISNGSSPQMAMPATPSPRNSSGVEIGGSTANPPQGAVFVTPDGTVIPLQGASPPATGAAGAKTN